MAPYLNDTHLLQFMAAFYGFGTYTGKYWLVGMEEAGGRTFADINFRLTQWQQSGCLELEDLPTHADRLGWGEKYFGAKPKWQPTWGKLIRIILAGEGLTNVNTAVIKQFQREQLGKHDSNHCLIELFPLPAQSTKHWIYDQHTKLSCLQHREKYLQHLAPKRINHIRSRLKQHQPKAVIFYGWKYRHWWEKIVGLPFMKHENLKCLMVVDNDIQFWVVNHPTATGITNHYFDQIGAQIATSAA